VIVKMNIEGAEYELLRHLIDGGSINYINELYVQYHDDKIDGIRSEDTDELQEKLSKIGGLKYAEFQKRTNLFQDYL